MTFLELAAKRVSHRSYQPAPVEPRLLDQILDAGRLAPSAANRQPWHFIVVRDPAMRLALGKGYSRDWFCQAPVIIVVCVDSRTAWVRGDGKNYKDVDGALAMDHMTLCAADLGLGTCWIGAFDAEQVKAILKIPPEIEPLAMTPLGYPADAGNPKKRKALSEIVHYDRW
jgi:nitroreductase